MSDKNTSGDHNGGGPNSIGGPLGGPGRPGKRLVTPQQDSGNYSGPGVPHNPHRGVSSQRNQDPKRNPSGGAGHANPAG